MTTCVSPTAALLPVSSSQRPQSADVLSIPLDHCVHVVDDDLRFLNVIHDALESSQIRTQCYSSAEQFLETYATHAADCVVLDVRMPDMNGLELLSLLRKNQVAPPILMLSAYADTPDIVSAIKRGAVDYLLKPINVNALLNQVVAALRVNWNSKQRYADLIQRLESLSVREREVMVLFAAAKTTIQVARELNISPKTVEKHRIHIFEKMNVDSVPALMRVLSDSPA